MNRRSLAFLERELSIRRKNDPTTWQLSGLKEIRCKSGLQKRLAGSYSATFSTNRITIGLQNPQNLPLPSHFFAAILQVRQVPEPPRQLPNVISFPEDEFIFESRQLSQIRFGLPGKNDRGRFARSHSWESRPYKCPCREIDPG